VRALAAPPYVEGFAVRHAREIADNPSDLHFRLETVDGGRGLSFLPATLNVEPAFTVSRGNEFIYIGASLPTCLRYRGATPPNAHQKATNGA
jgi:hypothetical protein